MVKDPSGPVPVTIDIFLVNRDRVDIAMIFFGVSKPLPLLFEQSLVSRVAARAA